MFQLSGFSNLKDRHITFNLPNNNLIPRKQIFRIPKQNVYSNNQDSVKNKGNLPPPLHNIKPQSILKSLNYIDKSKFTCLAMSD